MKWMFNAQNRMDRLYKRPTENVYTYRFFEDLCSSYSYKLGERNRREDFFAFEPQDSRLAKMFKEKAWYDLSDELEQMISNIIYSLMMYGKAYARITPEYSAEKGNDDGENIVLTALRISEIKGFVLKQNKHGISFCKKNSDDTVCKISMPGNQLIEFNIKDIGFSKRYFVKINKTLSKCDTLKTYSRMHDNETVDYDFTVHSKKNKIMELKALRNVGWTFGTDSLSDSYLLYKKIQLDKLMIKFLNYVVERINYGLCLYIGNEECRLVARIMEKKYDELWQDYSNGKITEKQLSDALYHNTAIG